MFWLVKKEKAAVTIAPLSRAESQFWVSNIIFFGLNVLFSSAPVVHRTIHVSIKYLYSNRTHRAFVNLFFDVITFLNQTATWKGKRKFSKTNFNSNLRMSSTQMTDVAPLRIQTRALIVWGTRRQFFVQYMSPKSLLEKVEGLNQTPRLLMYEKLGIQYTI